jgi:hypothetical protein
MLFYAVFRRFPVRFVHFLAGAVLASCLSFDSEIAVARVIEELYDSTLISQVKSTDVNNKKPNFVDINVQGYTIPVCTDSGVALKESSIKDIIYIAILRTVLSQGPLRLRRQKAISV